ncbi:MAG: hypothetical protein PHY67_03765 [Methanocorpusculum sp.]|nr:hypothetical protein [Methanocorpusculum sp.]
MVKVHLPDGTQTTTEAGTIEEILLRLNLNPYEILITRDNELLLADDFVNENDEIHATSIVHGG